jgi:hypothetical protein
LNILDALFVVISQRDANRFETNLTQTMSAVDSKRQR